MGNVHPITGRPYTNEIEAAVCEIAQNPSFMTVPTNIMKVLDNPPESADELVDILEEHPNVPRYYDTILQSFFDHANVRAIQNILEDGRVDPSAVQNYAIRSASGRGDIDKVNLLLQDDRVDPSALDQLALWNASGCKRNTDGRSSGYKVVKRLLNDPRVDPSARNNQAIRTACLSGCLKTVKILLKDPRVDIRANDHEALRFACDHGHSKIVKYLTYHYSIQNMPKLKLQPYRKYRRRRLRHQNTSSK